MVIETRIDEGPSIDVLTELRPQRSVGDDELRRLVVLVVEDDPDDREMIRRAFDDCLSDVDLEFVEDGSEAYDYLFHFGRRGRSGARRPGLILLDLNVPKMRGEAVLREVRHDPVLRTIPVLVFTGSENNADVRYCYDLGANTYFTKPSTIEGYRRVIRTLEADWLKRAELP